MNFGNKNNIKNNIILNKLIDEYEFNSKCILYSPLLDPIYIKMKDLNINNFDLNEDLIIFKDDHLNIYKCIPISILEKYRIIIDVIYDDDVYLTPSSSDDINIKYITISYCPYSKSAVIYEGIWEYSGLLYNDSNNSKDITSPNIILINNEKDIILPQIPGKPIYNNNNINNNNNNINIPIKYTNRICNWDKWRNSNNYHNSCLLFNKNFKYNNNNRYLFNKNINNNNNIHPSVGTIFGRNNDVMGFGFFCKDNSTKGYLFIKHNLLPFDTYNYEIMINIPNKLLNNFFIECKLSSWLLYFPFSKVL
jgi:hypothetical protein